MLDPRARCSQLVHRFEQLVRYVRARRAVTQLQSLDDHTLADIGVSRSAIERIVKNGRELGLM